MRRLVLVTLFTSYLSAQPHNTLSTEEKAQGWKLLFDGRTFQGWGPNPNSKPAGDSFFLDNGTIAVRKDPKFREDIATTSEWTDFDLRFEWKISEGGNSGVKYRVQDAIVIHPSFVPAGIRKFERQVDHAFQNRHTRETMPADGKGQIYQVAFEYQVIDDARHSDAKSSPKSLAGALYQMIPPSEHPAKPAGEWNTGRIVVKGEHVEHWINGRKVMDASLTDKGVQEGVEKRWGTASPVYNLLVKRPKRKGPIVLQNHNDAAWFRNLKIRALP